MRLYERGFRAANREAIGEVWVEWINEYPAFHYLGYSGLSPMHNATR